MKSFLKKHFENGIPNSFIIYIAFASVFLHFVLTAIVIIALSVYVFIKFKEDDLFSFKGAKWLIAFTVYTFIVAAVNLNYIGLACSLLFILLMELFLFTRKHITPHIFEKSLDISVLAGGITGLFCISDCAITVLRNGSASGYRATLYFFNCNYLATILATVIIICGYKILSRKPRPYIYLISALLCGIGVFLTGSMFALVEIFIGAAFLMFFMRKGQILAALLLMCGTAIIVLYCMPDLLPRLQQVNITTDNRIRIWNVSLEALKTAPIFGRGFLTYFHIQGDYPGSYFTTHSHNIGIECILSFGIVGTIFLLIFFLGYFRRVFICRNAQSKYLSSSLILALTFGLLAHSTTDLTFLWIQTGLFFSLLMGTIGCEEKLLKI